MGKAAPASILQLAGQALTHWLLLSKRARAEPGTLQVAAIVHPECNRVHEVTATSSIR